MSAAESEASQSTRRPRPCRKAELPPGPDRGTEIHWLRIADGKIVEHWTNFDQLGILQQLGALPGEA